MAEAKKDAVPASKRIRVRATQPGWYGNRRRIPGRPGAEFDLVLFWIPAQFHEDADPAKGIKAGDPVKGTGRHQKMPTWVEVVTGKKKVDEEVTEPTGDEEVPADQSPL